MTAPQPTAAPGAPAGGSGDGGQAPTGTQQPQQNPQQAATSAQPGPGAQQQPTGGQDLASQPEWVQKLVADLRSENASHRTAKQTAAQQAQEAQAQRDKVLAALGLKADGTDADPDPNALAAQIERANAVAWTNAVKLNVHQTAAGLGLNAAALLDSVAFLDSLDDFTEDDVTTPEFATKLAAHVKSYGEKHPQFKTQQTTAPPRAGTDRAAGSGGSPTRQPVQGLGAAIRAHYGQS